MVLSRSGPLLGRVVRKPVVVNSVTLDVIMKWLLLQVLVFWNSVILFPCA